MYPLLGLREAGGRSTHRRTIDFHRAPSFPLALLEFWHRTETMQARVVTQLNIRQPRFDTEQRPKKIISVLLKLSLGLLETFEFEVERFFLRDLLWCAVFEALEVLLSSKLPFCKQGISFTGEEGDRECSCRRTFLKGQQSEKFSFADFISVPGPVSHKFSTNTVVSVFQVLG